MDIWKLQNAVIQNTVHCNIVDALINYIPWSMWTGIGKQTQNSCPWPNHLRALVEFTDDSAVVWSPGRELALNDGVQRLMDGWWREGMFCNEAAIGILAWDLLSAWAGLRCSALIWPCLLPWCAFRINARFAFIHLTLCLPLPPLPLSQPPIITLNAVTN